MIIAMATYVRDERRMLMAQMAVSRLIQQADNDRAGQVATKVVIVDNGSIPEWTRYLSNVHLFGENVSVEYFSENRGTAEAINLAWSRRGEFEHCVKMDDDTIVLSPDWMQRMRQVFERDASIGICGLKRNDLDERPDSKVEFYRTELSYLPHQRGQSWIAVEYARHVMGTCQGFSAPLINKIGGLYQMQDLGNVYGFDDSLASVRSLRAGFKNCFLVNCDIDHLDRGGTLYTTWKQNQAQVWMADYERVKREYQTGERPLYWPLTK